MCFVTFSRRDSTDILGYHLVHCHVYTNSNEHILRAHVSTMMDNDDAVDGRS